MEGDRSEIYRLSTSCACVWNDKFCWHLVSCVHYSQFTLLPIYHECWTLWTELFWNDVIGFSFSEQLTSSSSSYDTVPASGFGGDYWRQTLAECRPSCNYFTSLCQSSWVKTGCCEKAGQTGREGERGADMLWYQMKGLLKPGNWIQEV